MNQALHVRCSSTSEIVWARLHGFPWWPALVVKPDGAGFQVGAELRVVLASRCTGRVVRLIGDVDRALSHLPRG